MGVWKKGFHPFHIVDLSPWPLVLSVLSLVLLCHGLIYVVFSSHLLLFCSCVISIVLVVSMWWRDVVRESTFSGEHTESVVRGLYLGIILFIMSEVMLFFSFFFGVFFVCLSPDISLGCDWPPAGIEVLSCFSVPMFNTVLLLSSGISITWAHYGLIEGLLLESLNGFMITELLGVVFLSVQVVEYFGASFSIVDCVYGSFFFLTTGFHGFHVLVGILFIIVIILRLMSFHFSKSHGVGVEAAVWYWHFVDVVWLFLFISIYWWGS